MTVKLVEIPQHSITDFVPGLLRAGANEALTRAADLDLGAVTVRWWREVQPDQPGVKAMAFPVTGWINTAVSDEINLNMTRLDGYAVTLAAGLHELRHLWQERNGRYLGQDGEDDCDRYVHLKTRPAPSAYTVTTDYASLF